MATTGTVADTERLLQGILKQKDPIARNRRITRCYLEICNHLADRVGRRDLNWFAYGMWASGTAGKIIRREGLPVDLGTSANVGAGNLTIIRDIAPPILRWLKETDGEDRPSDEALARTLRSPEVRREPKLADAIRIYHRIADLRAHPTNHAGVAQREKEIAELMLLANLRIGEQEQNVVDHFVDAAMPLGGVFGLITTHFISIETPDGPLDVSQDVVAPSYIAPQRFPDVLLHIENPELRGVCDRYGQSRGPDVSASDAASWEDYRERMGYILTFFRAYQRDKRFLALPDRFL